MKKAAENQMCPSLCFFRNYSVSPLYIAVLALCLIFIVYFSSLLASILLTFTLLIMIISTVFLFTFPKKKWVLEENQVKDESLSSSLNNLPEIEEVIQELQPKNEVFEPKKETQEVSVDRIHDYIAIKSPDTLSESESVGLASTSEDSDIDWPFRHDMGQIIACSDDSISDDESLIEIALPGGHYISPIEDPKLKLQPDFRQENLRELLAEINEMNEEENLIEIDISMGSIKCSRLEIEA